MIHSRVGSKYWMTSPTNDWWPQSYTWFDTCNVHPPSGTRCRQPKGGTAGAGWKWSPLLVLLRYSYVQRRASQEESRQNQVNNLHSLYCPPRDDVMSLIFCFLWLTRACGKFVIAKCVIAIVLWHLFTGLLRVNYSGLPLLITLVKRLSFWRVLFYWLLFFQQWIHWTNITREKEKGKTTKEEKTWRPSAKARKSFLFVVSVNNLQRNAYMCSCACVAQMYWFMSTENMHLTVTADAVAVRHVVFECIDIS